MTFPYSAVEEALANAVHHRGYDVREPIEVQVTPAEMTITSYPDPDTKPNPAVHCAPGFLLLSHTGSTGSTVKIKTVDPVDPV